MVPPKKALPNQYSPPEEVKESSSEEEEEEEEPSEDSDGEENKEKPNAPQNQISQAKKKPNIAEESEEEDLEESPASPSASDFTIKVVSPKRPTPKATKPASKRLSETVKIDEKALRKKKKAKVSEEDLKKEKSSGGPAGRVCSEEDERRILQGLIDFQEENGVGVSTDMGIFYPFVKGKLQAEITKTQLYEKVRRLKQKYFKNAERVGKGEDLVFSKPHDDESFDLSNRIWGGGLISNGDSEKVHVNGKSDGEKVRKNGRVESLDASAKKHQKIERKNSTKKHEKIEEKNNKAEEKDLGKEEEEMKDANDGGDFGEEYPFTVQAYNRLAGLITAEQVSFLKANLSLVGSETSREFEEKWKELQVEETELLLKKLQVFADHTRRVLDAIKKK